MADPGPDTLVLRHITTADDPWLARGEAVLRQLRPDLPTPFVPFAATILAGGGEFMVATRAAAVVGVALFRIIATTRSPRRFYLDDLVTDATQRSRGVGAAMLHWLEHQARTRQVTSMELESGLTRHDTHRFYERAGWERFAVSFRKRLD
ncbi:MAG: GNAT family N-acetyltransferase [Acidobacteriota bacterium]